LSVSSYSESFDRESGDKDRPAKVEEIVRQLRIRGNYVGNNRDYSEALFLLRKNKGDEG
jgi:hypothetical protein